MEIRHEKEKVSSITLRYNIIGTDSATEADEALMENSPESIGNGDNELKRNSVTVTKASNSSFEGVIEYNKPDKEEKEEVEEDGSGISYTYSFDTSGGTQHVTQSYQTLGSFAAQGSTAPNHNGAIGVTDGDITGCDIIVPQLTFTASKSMKGIIAPSYIRQLASLTGKINMNAFMGFGEGELLFEGATANQNFSDEGPHFDLTLKFRASPTMHNIQIGNITVTQKRGWDYLWVQYIEQEDTDSKNTKKFPIAAYVEAVYQEENFSSLII
ncbi:MAG: hypothetical protein LBP59_04810 [Planctomycetaceae bacterium]|nr:hypothetical protein [Planctomycetaceae bacterium]